MTYDIINNIKKHDKLYFEVHTTNPNSDINKIKSAELENKTKEVRKLKQDAKAAY